MEYKFITGERGLEVLLVPSQIHERYHFHRCFNHFHVTQRAEADVTRGTTRVIPPLPSVCVQDLK